MEGHTSKVCGANKAETDQKAKDSLIAQLDALSYNSQISRLEGLLGDVGAQLNLLYDRCLKEMREELDGKHFKLKDAKTGINYQPMHPNCRSTTVEWDPDDTLDCLNSGVPMPQRMSYEEWFEKQVRHQKTFADSPFTH